MKRPSVGERRTEILETACQVVIERGFGATRVSDVASRLDISTGLIHYHFESKDALLAEAFRHAAESDLKRLRAEVERSASAISRLDRIFRLNTPAEAEPGWLLWIDAWGEALRSPTLRAISQDLDLQWKETLEAIIRQGVDQGEFTCADPNAVAWRLSALLDGLGLQVTVHEGMLSRAQFVRWVRESACLELGLPQGTFTAKHLATRNGADPVTA